MHARGPIGFVGVLNFDFSLSKGPWVVLVTCGDIQMLRRDSTRVLARFFQEGPDFGATFGFGEQNMTGTGKPLG